MPDLIDLVQSIKDPITQVTVLTSQNGVFGSPLTYAITKISSRNISVIFGIYQDPSKQITEQLVFKIIASLK